MLGLVLVAFVARPVHAQQVIVHIFDVADEDGVAGKDADGARNGVVVWQGGAVHVVNQGFTANGSGLLVIQPGAVVKVAGMFNTRADGSVEQWLPPNEFNRLEGRIQASGATFTVIHDDSVGGDTNRDGSASSPFGTYVINLGWVDESLLSGNTIRYARVVGFGDATITDNTFQRALTMEQWVNVNRGRTYDASPLIRGNTFEDAGTLDLRGMTPVVENNTFRGAYLRIGPRRESSARPWSPTRGTAFVTGNRFENTSSQSAIELQDVVDGSERALSSTPFHVQIRDNVITGAGTGIRLAIDAFAHVSGNEVISPVFLPIRFDSHAASTPNVVVQHNRFGKGSGSSSLTGFSQWSTRGFIHAENNYWGDPSGPVDQSNADGLLNVRGTGVRMSGDGIDYVPFIGARPELGDQVHIAVVRNAQAPFQVGAAVTFTITADRVRLNTSTGADLHAIVRDDDGDVLGSRTTRVGLSTTSFAFQSLTVTVGSDSPYLIVEAVLVPDGTRRETTSNQERYRVNRTKGAFDLWSLSATDLNTNAWPQPTAGGKLRVRLNLGYTLNLPGQGAGTIEVYGDERIAGTGTVLTTFPAGGGPLATVPAPVGTNQTVQVDLPEITLPVRSRNAGRIALRGKIVLKDDKGVVLEEQTSSFDIAPPATIRITGVRPARLVNGQLEALPRQHFRADEPFNAFLDYRITTSLGQDVLAGSYRSSAAAERFSTTGLRLANGVLPLSNTTEGLRPNAAIPVGTRLAVFEVFLHHADGDVLVGFDSLRVEVHENAPTETRAVPAGSSLTAMDNLELLLTLSQNQQAGQVTAERVQGPYTEPRRAFDDAPVAAPMDALDYTAQRFIPLNKFWSLYGTLQEGRFTGRVTFRYTPADFPADPAFREDSLVVTALNPLSRELEPLPSVLDKAARTVTTDYSTFFQTYVVASRRTVLVSPADPEARAAAFGLEAPYPNPSRGETVVAFTLASPAFVTVRVFDLLGRAVVTLLEGPRAPGRHTVHWDGRDGAGGPVPGGIYLVRMTGEGGVRVRPVVRVR